MNTPPTLTYKIWKKNTNKSKVEPLLGMQVQQLNRYRLGDTLIAFSSCNVIATKRGLVENAEVTCTTLKGKLSFKFVSYM